MRWSVSWHGLGQGCWLELETEVHKVFTITEKAPTRAFSWLKGDKVDNTWSKTLVTLMYFRNDISKADRGCVNRR